MLLPLQLQENRFKGAQKTRARQGTGRFGKWEGQTSAVDWEQLKIESQVDGDGGGKQA
jgi:hypothetical protein